MKKYVSETETLFLYLAAETCSLFVPSFHRFKMKNNLMYLTFSAVCELNALSKNIITKIETGSLLSLHMHIHIYIHIMLMSICFHPRSLPDVQLQRHDDDHIHIR